MLCVIVRIAALPREWGSSSGPGNLALLPCASYKPMLRFFFVFLFWLFLLSEQITSWDKPLFPDLPCSRNVSGSAEFPDRISSDIPKVFSYLLWGIVAFHRQVSHVFLHRTYLYDTTKTAEKTIDRKKPGKILQKASKSVFFRCAL